VLSTIIPDITAFDPYSSNTLFLEFNVPSSGFLLEQELTGWNYNTNMFDSISGDGARPYWALLDIEKDSTTKYKGVYSWGYGDVYVSEYLPNIAPVFSPMRLQYGNAVEYVRRGYSFIWNQPIDYLQRVNTTTWCEISSFTTPYSNLSSLYDIKKNPEINAIATTTPSDILLSNIIDGSPVEIYYNALNEFNWITTYPIKTTNTQSLEISAQFVPIQPWANSSNRFYPTIANVPVVSETYTAKDVGGYFLPQHLGASVFINKNFNTYLSSGDLLGTYITEDSNIYVGGRGRTGQDQPTIYDWTENNQWIKESITKGNLAGSIKKNLTKEFQTFIPYQSNSDETALGLVTTQSRLSPWGGINDEEWKDVANEPKGFTGIRNLSAWAASQVLKQNKKAVDKWVSDVYGNQYGLFKQLDGIPVAEHGTIPGELWIKTNAQTVKPASQILSTIFDSFKVVNSSIYNDLVGNGIKNINFYFNTLFIETSGASIFTKIDYDYNNEEIISIFDNARYILTIPNKSSSIRFEQNWVVSSETAVISLYTSITGTDYFEPMMYYYDCNTLTHKKIFPLEANSKSNLTASMQKIRFKSLNKATITYNQLQQMYVITYTGVNTLDDMFVVDFYIKNEKELLLTDINLYKNINLPIIQVPPTVLSPYLSAINVPSLVPFTRTVVFDRTTTTTDIRYPMSISLLNYTESLQASADRGMGIFTGTLSAGLHHINYKISNSVGSSIYCLTLSAL